MTPLCPLLLFEQHIKRRVPWKDLHERGSVVEYFARVRGRHAVAGIEDLLHHLFAGVSQVAREVRHLEEDHRFEFGDDSSSSTPRFGVVAVDIDFQKIRTKPKPFADGVDGVELDVECWLADVVERSGQRPVLWDECPAVVDVEARELSGCVAHSELQGDHAIVASEPLDERGVAIGDRLEGYDFGCTVFEKRDGHAPHVCASVYDFSNLVCA